MQLKKKLWIFRHLIFSGPHSQWRWTITDWSLFDIGASGFYGDHFSYYLWTGHITVFGFMVMCGWRSELGKSVEPYMKGYECERLS